MMKFLQTGPNTYRLENGWSFAREEGYTPNGNPIGGRWVLRNNKGNFFDVDQYRHDLAERNDIQLIDAGW